jgi:hypothetical protein
MVDWRGRQPITNAEFAKEFKDRNQKFDKENTNNYDLWLIGVDANQ